MVKHSGGLTFASIQLDSKAATPMFQQLYQELREAILLGRLAPGVRLPSTRMLAQELSVSRNTVVSAFDQLLAEGYFESQVGSGTYVCRELPEEMLTLRQSSKLLSNPESRTVEASPAEKTPFPQDIGFVVRHQHEEPRAFRPGVPSLEAFPHKLWSRLLMKYWRQPPQALLNYGNTAGYTPLRQAIADHLRTARGVQCKPEQVIIIAGSQQGLSLVSRVLLQPGDPVWIEDPGYTGARSAFEAAGAKLIPVPLDSQGLDVAAGERVCPEAKLAFVSPSHQYPLGMTLSLQRRLALLNWAHRANAWVVEDDYDSEICYTGRPIASLQGLDQGQRVIYIGTFSKVLFPSLRLGYLVVPEALIEPFLVARALADQHSPQVEQAVLADFITEGFFSRHIRHMRALYASRQEALVQAAQTILAGRLTLRPHHAGMHLIGWLDVAHNDQEIHARAMAAGIESLPLSRFCLTPYPKQGLLLGYAAVDEASILKGVQQLAKIL